MATRYRNDIQCVIFTISRCMYILPKDLQKEANVLDVIPYVFDVDVIKDCSSLKNEIADVFSVISRDNGTYFTSIEKVCYFVLARAVAT